MSLKRELKSYQSMKILALRSRQKRKLLNLQQKTKPSKEKLCQACIVTHHIHAAGFRQNDWPTTKGQCRKEREGVIPWEKIQEQTFKEKYAKQDEEDRKLAMKCRVANCLKGQEGKKAPRWLQPSLKHNKRQVSRPWHCSSTILERWL